MRKITLIASGISMFIGGYFLGRRKFKKLFETVCDVSKEEYEYYVSTYNENDKLWNDNLSLDRKNSELWEKNLELDIENTNLKEKIDRLEIINNDYEECLLDVRDLIKDKHMCDKIEVLDIFKTLIDKHDIDEIIGWNHSSD